MAGFSFFSDLITPTSYDIPDLGQVNVGEIQKQTAADNAASFKAAQKFSSEFNDYMEQEVAKRLKKQMPYMASQEQQMAANISSKLKGELPQTVIDQSVRESNARSRRLGISGGSGMQYNLSTRDVIRDRLAYQAQGEAEWAPFVTSVANLKRAPMFDFSNLFMSAPQRMALATEERNRQWNIQNIRNQMEAQPEPWMKAFAGLGDSLSTYAFNTFGGMMNPMGGSGNWGTGGTNRNTFTVGDYTQSGNAWSESRGRGIGSGSVLDWYSQSPYLS